MKRRAATPKPARRPKKGKAPKRPLRNPGGPPPKPHHYLLNVTLSAPLRFALGGLRSVSDAGEELLVELEDFEARNAHEREGRREVRQRVREGLQTRAKTPAASNAAARHGAPRNLAPKAPASSLPLVPKSTLLLPGESISEAAKRLNVARSTLRDRLKLEGITAAPITDEQLAQMLTEADGSVASVASRLQRKAAHLQARIDGSALLTNLLDELRRPPESTAKTRPRPGFHGQRRGARRGP